jgi:hypothetical protein
VNTSDDKKKKSSFFTCILCCKRGGKDNKVAENAEANHEDTKEDDPNIIKRTLFSFPLFLYLPSHSP